MQIWSICARRLSWLPALVISRTARPALSSAGQPVVVPISRRTVSAAPAPASTAAYPARTASAAPADSVVAAGDAPCSTAFAAASGSQRHVVRGQRGGGGGGAERFGEQAGGGAGQRGGDELGGDDAQPARFCEEGGDRGAVPEFPGRQHDPAKQHRAIDELPARAAQQAGQRGR